MSEDRRFEPILSEIKKQTSDHSFIGKQPRQNAY